MNNRKCRMKKESFKINLVRRDTVKVAFDPEYFNEEWFEEFRQFFYDFFTLEDCV
ncbi:hypothetical protein P7E11_10860 [Enterococcus gallinarum]|nr:hypothetical protein [Enterococcus gallinarum]